MTQLLDALCSRARETAKAWVSDNWGRSIGTPETVLDNLINYDDAFRELWGQWWDARDFDDDATVDPNDPDVALMLEAIASALPPSPTSGCNISSDHADAIIQHLTSMCPTPTTIEIRSAAEIDGGAIFAVFAFAGEAGGEQTAIYYPADDILFTPRDWQGGQPMDVDEIPDYQWITSAGDEAIVLDGLPRSFTAIRDAARKDYGRKVRAAREAMGLTAEELARRAGLGRSHINRVEAWRYNLTLDTMTRIGAVLGTLS